MTKKEQKDQAWEEYLAIIDPAWEEYLAIIDLERKKYEAKCKEIDEQVEDKLIN